MTLSLTAQYIGLVLAGTRLTAWRAPQRRPAFAGAKRRLRAGRRTQDLFLDLRGARPGRPPGRHRLRHLPVPRRRLGVFSV